MCEAKERMRWGRGLKEETCAKQLCETVHGLLRNLACSRRIFERARQHCLNQSCLKTDRIRNIPHHRFENWTCLPECRYKIRFGELCDWLILELSRIGFVKHNVGEIISRQILEVPRGLVILGYQAFLAVLSGPCNASKHTY